MSVATIPSPGRSVARAMAIAPQPVPSSSTRAGAPEERRSSASSTRCSVSGRGINTSAVTRSARPENSRQPVMWETGSPARRRANRACAARALDESIPSSAWTMSRTRSQPRMEQSNSSASNRGNPDSRSKPPIVAPVSTAFIPEPASTLIGERSELLCLVLGEQRLRQLGKIAVHDVVDLVEGETDAVVGDPSLRKIIGADALGTVPRADQGFARGGFLGLLLAQLPVLDACRQHREGLFLSLVLGAPVLALHDHAGR